MQIHKNMPTQKAPASASAFLFNIKNQTPYLVVETGIPTPIVEATVQDLR